MGLFQTVDGRHKTIIAERTKLISVRDAPARRAIPSVPIMVRHFFPAKLE